MNNEVTLTSLAMLKVNADVEGRDYIDYVVPFVSYGLEHEQPDPVTSLETQEILIKEFGLRIPSQVLELVLRRLAKRGLLRRGEGTFHVANKITALDIEFKRVDARRRLNLVVTALIEFVNNTFDTEWKPDNATRAITGYLSHFSIDFLRSYAQGSALPEVKADQRELFLVNSFVSHIQTRLPEIFDSFIVLVKGHMLANALICPDLDSLSRKFSNLTFFLDTPLVIRLLGLQGDAPQKAVSELLELLRNLRGGIAIFEHTAEEVHSVIQASELHFDDPKASRMPIIQLMRNAGKTASDLTLVRARLDHYYSSFGIGRRETPRYIGQFQIDEEILQDALEDRYLNPRALEYDINSIRSIYALRTGRHPRRLEDANAVFVTSNTPLAKAAYEYGKNNESTREVSSVVTDFSLANIAWLKCPLQFPDLPRFEVVATCYAAMNPTDSLWSRYLTEIDKLKSHGDISEKDHELLRSSLHARDELMNVTLGAENDFSATTVSEILERVKADLVKEQLAILDSEKASHAATREEYERQLKERNVLLERERMNHELTKTETGRLQQEQQEFRDRLCQISLAAGRLVGTAAMLLLALVLFTFLAYSAFYTPGQKPNRWVAVGGVIVSLSLIIWGMVNWAYGVALKDISKKIEGWVQKRLFNLLTSLFHRRNSVRAEQINTPADPTLLEAKQEEESLEESVQSQEPNSLN